MAVPQEAQCPLRNGSIPDSGPLPDSISNLSYSAVPATEPTSTGERDWRTSLSCSVEGCGLYSLVIVKMQSDQSNAIRSLAGALSINCETRELLNG